MAEFVEWAKIEGVAVNEVFKWGSARGWIERAKGDERAVRCTDDSGQRATRSRLMTTSIISTH